MVTRSVCWIADRVDLGANVNPCCFGILWLVLLFFFAKGCYLLNSRTNRVFKLDEIQRLSERKTLISLQISWYVPWYPEVFSLTDEHEAKRLVKRRNARESLGESKVGHFTFRLILWSTKLDISVKLWQWTIEGEYFQVSQSQFGLCISPLSPLPERAGGSNQKPLLRFLSQILTRKP